jgi:DNA invertase Pin-like site-specific DNA recombinase
MAKIGYARVSSFGQSLDVQLSKLEDCDRVFQEKKSARTDQREQLSLCLDYVRDGDTLVITKLDRLARSTRDLLNIAKRLEDKKVELSVLDQQIDTSTASGKLLLNMLAVIAEFENDLRKDRQMQGINLAKSKGIKFGRKKALNAEEIQTLKSSRTKGATISDLMLKFDISKATAYRYLENSSLSLSDNSSIR